MTPSRNSSGGIPNRDTAAKPQAATPQELDLLQAIRELTFGTVEITVHNGRIVQITRSEKRRYE